MTNTFITQVLKQRGQTSAVKVVGLDPGETTGVCVFTGVSMTTVGQISTGQMPLAASRLREFILGHDPDVVVIEDYRVYKWKADQHAWAELHTPKLIGALHYICHIMKIPVVFQSAQVGKGFCTDDRLKEWGFYQISQRHGNDAVRHAAHWLMFGKDL